MFQLNIYLYVVLGTLFSFYSHLSSQIYVKKIDYYVFMSSVILLPSEKALF